MPSKMQPPPPPAQPASLRQGPRPLPLHLAAASFTWASSLAALPLLRNGLLALRPELRAAGSQLAAELAAAEPEALAVAVAREAQQRLASFLEAIATYRRHPLRRPAAMVPVLWQQGTTRLLDYGGKGRYDRGRFGASSPFRTCPLHNFVVRLDGSSFRQVH